jgi:hypothetical protein
MAYTIVDRKRIHLKAQRKLGLKKKEDKKERSDWVDSCVLQLVDSGDYDEEEAQELCEDIWGSDTGGYVD